MNDVENFAGYIALEAADGFEFRMPFIEPFSDVCLGTRIGSQAADGNDMQCAVRGPIAAAVQTMLRYLP